MSENPSRETSGIYNHFKENNFLSNWGANQIILDREQPYLPAKTSKPCLDNDGGGVLNLIRVLAFRLDLVPNHRNTSDFLPRKNYNFALKYEKPWIVWKSILHYLIA